MNIHFRLASLDEARAQNAKFIIETYQDLELGVGIGDLEICINARILRWERVYVYDFERELLGAVIALSLNSKEQFVTLHDTNFVLRMNLNAQRIIELTDHTRNDVIGSVDIETMLNSSASFFRFACSELVRNLKVTDATTIRQIRKCCFICDKPA